MIQCKKDCQLIHYLLPTKESISVFANEINTLKIKAHQKEATLKPVMTLSNSIIIKALMTKEKSPNVNMVIGKEMICKSGLTKTLMMANTTAVNIAYSKLLTAIPEN